MVAMARDIVFVSSFTVNVAFAACQMERNIVHEVAVTIGNLFACRLSRFRKTRRHAS